MYRRNMPFVLALVTVLMLCIQNCIGKFKIFNGKDITSWSSTDYQFMVLLTEGEKCSGSWIGTNKVLTSAHCFVSPAPPKSVWFEYTSTGKQPTESIPILRQTHPGQYDNFIAADNKYDKRSYDISIITMKAAPSKCKAITKLRLTYDAILEVGTIMIMVGYGRNREIRTGDLREGMAKIATCSPKYSNGVICVRKDAEFNNQNTDKGDSGSPLLLPISGGVECVGISSSNHAPKDSPGVFEMIYTSLSKNKDFIKSNL